MTINKQDAIKAVDLLKKFRANLAENSEKSLRNSMDRLINVLNSDLFASLVDIQEYYEQLLDSNANPYQSVLNSHFVDSQDGMEGNTRENYHLTKGFDKPEDTVSPVEQSEWEYLQVLLTRSAGKNQSFGFSIAGGYDAPQENGDPSVFITRLAPGGLADVDDRLRPFDQIISVNGTDLTCVSNEEALQILRDSGDTLAIIVRRLTGTELNSVISPTTQLKEDNYLEYQDESAEVIWYEVELVKPNTSTGLGFSIAGGQDSNDDLLPEGIFITRITPGGLAEKNGLMQPGDRLVQVNGIDLKDATHSEAVDILRNAGTHVYLLVCRFPSTNSQESNLSGSNDELDRRFVASPSSSFLSQSFAPSHVQTNSSSLIGRYKKR